MKKIFFILVSLLFSSPFLNAQENLALGKTANQSSNSNNAGLAVDGNIDGNYNNGSVTHTNEDKGAWWQVDLGALYDITKIKLYNRTDCCANRLSDFTILVSETSFINNSGGTAFVEHEQYVADKVRRFSGNSQGRYVRVFLNGSDYLSLAEVEVYGAPAETKLPVNPPNGTMVFYNSGDWQVLAPGSDGSTLTLINGLPVWTHPSSGENFTVFLNSAGGQKLRVIKEVKNLLGIELTEAKELVDKAPCAIKENISQEEAKSIKTQLEDVGAQVSVRQ